MANENETNAVVEETANPTTETETVEESQENEQVNTEEVDEVEEIEFDDSDTADEEEPNVEKKKKPSRDKEREYAKRRREQKEREMQDSYFKGIKTVLGDYNPYTNEKMETDEDVKDYLNMKEMENEGLDPTNTSDYIKFMKNKQKQELEVKNQQEKIELKMNTERAEFKAKYPNVDIETLISGNKNWNKAILAQIASGSTLLEAYESVNSLIEEQVNKQAEVIADEKAKKQVQNSLASTGSLTDGEEPLNSGATVNIREMTDEQFNDYWKRKYGG